MSAQSDSRQFFNFWPFVIVVVTLVLLQIFGLTRTYDQRRQINENIAKLEQAQDEAKKIDTILGSVSQDLLNLSASNDTAKRVIAEFQIRKNDAAPSPSPATP